MRPCFNVGCVIIFRFLSFLAFLGHFFGTQGPHVEMTFVEGQALKVWF